VISCGLPVIQERNECDPLWVTDDTGRNERDQLWVTDGTEEE